MIYCVRPCSSFSKRAAPDKQTRAERRTFAMRCSRRFVKLEPTLASGQHDVHETADTVLSLINGVRDEWITRRESTLTCNGCGSSRRTLDSDIVASDSLNINPGVEIDTFSSAYHRMEQEQNHRGQSRQASGVTTFVNARACTRSLNVA